MLGWVVEVSVYEVYCCEFAYPVGLVTTAVVDVLKYQAHHGPYWFYDYLGFQQDYIYNNKRSLRSSRVKRP